MSKKSVQKKTMLNYFRKETPQTNEGAVSTFDVAISDKDIAEAGPSGESSSPHTLPIDHKSKHRLSGINKQWFKDFDWLMVKENGMWCSLCMKYSNKHPPKRELPWVNMPCTRIRKESLLDHGKSKTHIDSSADLLRKRVLEKTGFGQIERSVSVLNNLQRDAFVGALRSMYWLAKNELPHTTLFEKLLEYCKEMGCSFLKHLNVGKNAHYTSERIMQELLDVLASSIKSDILKSIQDDHFFSILCDETTDISVLKQLIIYIKYVCNVTREVRISFVSTHNMIDGKAETITNTLVESMDTLGLKIANLVGLGSDGAAVMIGKQKGVAKLLKDKTSGLLVNCHCVNHRLALASAQAAAAVPYLTKLNDILRQLFYFFQNSSVRMAGLTEIQNILNIPQIKLKMASDTRWLSHDSAVQSLRQCMMSVIAALEREATERNDITAEGLSRCIKTYNFVSSLMMLSDVLPLLSNLSKAWQRQDVNLTEIEPILLATKLSIMDLKDTPGRYSQSLHRCLAEEWSDLHIVYTESNVMLFKTSIYDKYLETVVKHLDARFPDMPIISSFSKVFNAETPDPSASAEILCDYYSKNGSPPILNYESSRQEWTVASKMIKSQSYKDFSPRQILLKMATTSELKESFPNLAKLAHIGLVIPVSTAECERGFSALKRIKTCLRNRMNQNTLNNLMLISLEGPDPRDMDYGKAADNWASRKKRKINI
ncbi:zinc finger protein 862-like [Mantella aurantiaca]